MWNEVIQPFPNFSGLSLYNGCDYVSMVGILLNHGSKGATWRNLDVSVHVIYIYFQGIGLKRQQYKNMQYIFLWRKSFGIGVCMYHLLSTLIQIMVIGCPILDKIANFVSPSWMEHYLLENTNRQYCHLLCRPKWHTAFSYTRVSSFSLVSHAHHIACFLTMIYQINNK